MASRTADILARFEERSRVSHGDSEGAGLSHLASSSSSENVSLDSGDSPALRVKAKKKKKKVTVKKVAKARAKRNSQRVSALSSMFNKEEESVGDVRSAVRVRRRTSKKIMEKQKSFSKITDADQYSHLGKKKKKPLIDISKEKKPLIDMAAKETYGYEKEKRKSLRRSVTPELELEKPAKTKVKRTKVAKRTKKKKKRVVKKKKTEKSGESDLSSQDESGFAHVSAEEPAEKNPASTDEAVSQYVTDLQSLTKDLEMFSSKATLELDDIIRVSPSQENVAAADEPVEVAEKEAEKPVESEPEDVAEKDEVVSIKSDSDRDVAVSDDEKDVGSQEKPILVESDHSDDERLSDRVIEIKSDSEPEPVSEPEAIPETQPDIEHRAEAVMELELDTKHEEEEEEPKVESPPLSDVESEKDVVESDKEEEPVEAPVKEDSSAAASVKSDSVVMSDDEKMEPTKYEESVHSESIHSESDQDAVESVGAESVKSEGLEAAVSSVSEAKSDEMEKVFESPIHSESEVDVMSSDEEKGGVESEDEARIVAVQSSDEEPEIVSDEEQPIFSPSKDEGDVMFHQAASEAKVDAMMSDSEESAGYADAIMSDSETKSEEDGFAKLERSITMDNLSDIAESDASEHDKIDTMESDEELSAALSDVDEPVESEDESDVDDLLGQELAKMARKSQRFGDRDAGKVEDEFDALIAMEEKKSDKFESDDEFGMQGYETKVSKFQHVEYDDDEDQDEEIDMIESDNDDDRVPEIHVVSDGKEEEIGSNAGGGFVGKLEELEKLSRSYTNAYVKEKGKGKGKAVAAGPAEAGEEVMEEGDEQNANPPVQAEAPIKLNHQEAMELLIKGMFFVKYGRSGKPHDRFIYLDEKTRRVCWSKKQKKKVTGSMSTNTLMRVSIGRDTDVFRRNDKKPKAKANMEEKKLNSLSLIGTTRTLDIEASSRKHAEAWRSAFELLVGFKNSFDQLLKFVK